MSRARTATGRRVGALLRRAPDRPAGPGTDRAGARALTRRTVCLTAVVIWGGLLGAPAGAPVADPPAGAPVVPSGELAAALAERTAGFRAAASRSAPAPVPEVVVEVAPAVVWPAPGPLTGWFGERRRNHRHPGIDIDGATGDAVLAAAAGLVTAAGPAPAGYAGYGNVVVIDHGDGLTSISAHLSRVTVRSGARVVPGQLVGAVGTSGRVTGSHLHFELRRGGAVVDPRDWLPGR